VHYAPSASAGHSLDRLNDHHGVMTVAGRIGDSTVAERVAIYKAEVDGEAKFFVKGFGDRAIKFEDFADALERLSVSDAQAQARRSDDLKPMLREAQRLPAWVNPLMETPLRSEILVLSLRSQLTFRRDDKESDDKLMGLQPNPTPMPRAVAWANGEQFMPPGAGPKAGGEAGNGTRCWMTDLNVIEQRVMFFLNQSGNAPRGDAISASAVPGLKAPVPISGPVLAEVAGLRRWQLVAPASEQSGVAGGYMDRGANAAKWMLKKSLGYGEAVASERADGDGEDLAALAPHLKKPAVHIRLTTQDNAVHDLLMTERGLSLSLAKTTAGNARADALGALGGGMQATLPDDERRGRADFNAYSYDGRDTGRFGTASGLPDPMLVLSTRDSLPVGPLLKAPSTTTNLLNLGLQAALYRPQLGGANRGGAARVANLTLRAAGKFATTLISAQAGDALRGADGVFIPGAQPFSGIGSGTATPGILAASASVIVASQELFTVVKEALAPVLPEPWKKPNSLVVQNLLTFLSSMSEEMLRLEVNLGVQKALDLREGTAWDHGTLAASSAIKAALETWKANIGGPEARPYVHAAIDAIENLQYLLLRVTGQVLGQSPGEAGRLRQFNEAARSRVVLRLYDQTLAPLFTQLLNAEGVFGQNANVFDHQIARERMIRDLGSRVSDGLEAYLLKGDRGPLESMFEDKSVLATALARIDQVLVGDFDGPNPSPASVAQHVAAGAQKVGELLVPTRRKPGDTEFFSDIDLYRYRVKRFLNRVNLYANHIGATHELFAHLYLKMRDRLIGSADPLDQVEAGAAENVVARAMQAQRLERAIAANETDIDPVRGDIEMQPVDPRLAWEGHLAENDRALDAIVASARAFAGGQADLAEDQPYPITSTLSETSVAQQGFTRMQQDYLRAHPDAGVGLQPSTPLPVSVDFGQRRRPAASSVTTFGTTAQARAQGGVKVSRVPRRVGTFSTHLEASALERHLQMNRAPGLATLFRSRPAFLGGMPAIEPAKPLSDAMLKRTELASIDYTNESGPFHYALRWEVTGDPRHVPIAPGVSLVYRAMNAPANVRGEKHLSVDPIEALYVNMAVARSEKFPAPLQRAVVTEARYLGSARRDASGQALPEGAGEMVQGCSLAILTEILSTTSSKDVVEQFLNALGCGSTERAQTQHVYAATRTGVNASGVSDLVQAEVIFMPGAVFELVHVDENSGRRPIAGADDQAVGQVIYLRQLDTYKLEQDFHRYLDPQVGYFKPLGDSRESRGEAPAEGTRVIHPVTGQFLQFTTTLEKGDIVYDPTSDRYREHDGSPPMDEGGLKFEGAFKWVSPTKNYFLGRAVEHSPTNQALWRHPFTAEGAKRTIKDAIHAAIVRGIESDPIVEHLDEATENANHQHLARMGGHWRTEQLEGRAVYSNPYARAEFQVKAVTKTLAGKIVEELLAPDDFGKAVDPVRMQMLAWMLASLTRRPIRLIPVLAPAPGLPPEGLSFTKTYDKVDLARDPLTPKDSPEILIGAALDGFHALRATNDGRFEPTHRIGGHSEGATAENLILAFLRAGPLRKAHFPEFTGAGGERMFIPSDAAARSAATLYGKLRQVFSTDYFNMARAIVEEAGAASARIADGEARRDGAATRDTP
jgi:hypothetical protein